MRNWRTYGGIAAVLAAVTVGGVVLHIKASGNFYAITDHEAYRSDQLNREQFVKYINRYGIKSVLNLRGRNPSRQWYQDEIAVCQELGVQHYDIAFSAKAAPTPDQEQRLMSIFRTAPRPIWIHCLHGADRSGLVAAMWKEMVDGRPKAEAAKQLSVRFGHVPFFGTEAMDNYFESWNPPAESAWRSPSD